MATNYTKPEVYWIERDAIAIATQSATTGELSGPPASKTVTLFVVRNFTHFTGTLTTDITTLGLPFEFIDAIIAKSISRGHELGDLKKSEYWNKKFNEYVKEGKRYANTNRDGSNFTIIGHDY